MNSRTHNHNQIPFLPVSFEQAFDTSFTPAPMPQTIQDLPVRVRAFARLLPTTVFTAIRELSAKGIGAQTISREIVDTFRLDPRQDRITIDRVTAVAIAMRGN